MEEAKHLLKDVTFYDDPYSPLEKADCVVLVTEWNQFRALDLEKVKSMMAQPIMIDLRNVYARTDIRDRGFTYVAIGMQ